MSITAIVARDAYEALATTFARICMLLRLSCFSKPPCYFVFEQGFRHTEDKVKLNAFKAWSCFIQSLASNKGD